MIRFLAALALLGLIQLASPGSAAPADDAPGLGAVPATAPEIEPIVVLVSLSTQQMQVLDGEVLLYTWPVSTARPGKITPTGTWSGAEWLSRNHRSSLYHNAPMPYSIFFNGNYAIHGTDQIRKLGTPASAGCIRLHPDLARVLFEMVLTRGKTNLRVEIHR